MNEVHRAYKERLIDERFIKEEKYNKIKNAKLQLVQDAQMPTDYGVMGLLEAEKGVTRN